jgi:hypothetical protein
MADEAPAGGIPRPNFGPPQFDQISKDGRGERSRKIKSTRPPQVETQYPRRPGTDTPNQGKHLGDYVREAKEKRAAGEANSDLHIVSGGFRITKAGREDLMKKDPANPYGMPRPSGAANPYGSYRSSSLGVPPRAIRGSFMSENPPDKTEG